MLAHSRMLRASGEAAGLPVDVRAVANAARDSGLRWGRELLSFTDAIVTSDLDALPGARAALVDVAGRPATARAAAVAGNFTMMNLLLDAAGVPVPARARQAAQELGIEAIL